MSKSTKETIATVKESKASTKESNYSAKSGSFKWPYCIVWTPLPVVTWFLPIIGHTGISNSKGIIYDFSDVRGVGVDSFPFGDPTKVFEFKPNLIRGGAKAWDKAIQQISDYYAKTKYNIYLNNCHWYIADVLNVVNYDGRKDWTQVSVWYMITFQSRWTDVFGFMRQWSIFIIIILATVLVLVLIF